jgi:hypothetical protein
MKASLTALPLAAGSLYATEHGLFETRLPPSQKAA